MIYRRNTKNSSTYFFPSGAINDLCAGSGRGGSRVIPRWYTGFLEEELPSPPSPPHHPQPRHHYHHCYPQHHHHQCEHAPPKDHPNEAPSTASVPPVSP